MQDPNLWHLNRKSVAGAVAVSLFIAYLPMPMQMPAAGLLAVLFRVNLTISVALVWITNPVTMPIMYYVAYLVGSYVLGVEAHPEQITFGMEGINTLLGELWKPFVTGCVIMGAICSLTGYLIVQAVWRFMVIRRYNRRGKGKSG